MKKWIHKYHFTLLESMFMILLFTISFIIRSHLISDNLFFGFEQGRDALIATKIANLDDFVLVGPKTDIGGVFHGAWYYYLLALPYGVSGGNPLSASYFIIALSSLVPVVFYKLLKRMEFGIKWALIGGMLAMISYRLIEYSRWLSNVTPAVLFASISFIHLWDAFNNKSQRGLILFSFFFFLATQFQIILVLFYFPALFFICIWKRIKPSWKTIFVIIVIGLFWFAPMILFQIRNDWITLLSISQFINRSVVSQSYSIMSVIPTMYKIIFDYVGHSIGLVTIKSLQVCFVALIGIAGIISFIKKNLRMQYLFFIVILSCYVPLVMFPNEAGLQQLYVYTPIVVIGLLIVSLMIFWDLSWWGKGLVMGILLLVGTTIPTIMDSLQRNEPVFFRTFQDDLNLKDQRNILSAMHEHTKSFEWVAYTIPYYQSEAWQYLLDYYHVYQKPIESTIIFVIIESHVNPYWRETWLKELPQNNLVKEEQFGKLTLQMREKILNPRNNQERE